MPSIRERFQAAADVFRHGYAAPMPAPGGVKMAPFLWPAWRRGTPEWHMVDVDGYIEEGFNLNTLVYSAIMYKVRSGSAAPLRAYTGDPENPELLPAEAPLAKLLARPNPHQSWVELQGQNIVYLNISGDAFIWLDRGRRGRGLPDAMYSLRPDRVLIVPGKDGRGLAGYLYVPEGASAWIEWSRRQRLDALSREDNPALLFVPEDVMHVKLPNPMDPLEGMGYGMPPIAPLARSADVDNKITEFLKLFFDGGAMPSGLLKFNVPLQDAEISRIRERWHEIYGGFENWDEIGILDSGGEYQRLGFSFEEMGFGSLDERNEARILAPFGVPPILVGARVGLAHSTYSNYAQARQSFWQDTFIPEVKLFEVEFQYYLQDDGGKEFVRFDLAKVPALTEIRVGLVDAWAKLVDRGIPKARAAETVGLDLGQLVDGDVVYMPQGMIPVADPERQLGAPSEITVTKPGPSPSPAQLPSPRPAQGRATPEEDHEGAAEAEADTRPKAADGPGEPGAGPEPAEEKTVTRWTAMQKLNHWKAFDALATDAEPALVAAARECFDRDRREVLALLNGAKAAAVKQKATVAWSELLLSWKDYFQMAGENWREVFTPILAGIVQVQAERWAAELGMSFDVRNLLAEQWFREYTLTFAQPILETTEKDLSSLLETARAEGWSIPQMQKAIEALFNQYLGDASLTDEQRQWFQDRLPAYRLELIARTESLTALNSGSFQLFKSWDAPLKEWLATPDERTRDDHRDAGRKYGEGGTTGPIPIDQPFIVGGEKLMYPGDPVASPAQRCNCRCTILPAWPKGQGPGEQSGATP